jgi:hypothetical protein
MTAVELASNVTVTGTAPAPPKPVEAAARPAPKPEPTTVALSCTGTAFRAETSNCAGTSCILISCAARTYQVAEDSELSPAHWACRLVLRSRISVSPTASVIGVDLPDETGTLARICRLGIRARYFPRPGTMFHAVVADACCEAVKA